MLSVVILGTGNLAKHLFDAFSTKKNVQIIQVFGRNSNVLTYFESKVSVTKSLDELLEADVYLMAVTDDAISNLSKQIKPKKGILAHTSGTVSLDAILNTNRGVFYPLQTFTKDKSVDFKSIPICLEANNTKNLEILGQLAASLSNAVYEITSQNRKKLHLAAVFVNNFSNHMYQIGSDICAENELSFDLLKPLIVETAEKIRFLGPKSAQTGPAVRNDIKTMQRHLDELKDPIHKKIYQLMSESIKQNHEKEL